MSRARHKANGGKVVYAGAGSNVLKEAMERKRGGSVKHTMAEGAKAKHRLDRPGRKRGGRIGADKAPLSSAARVSHVGSSAGSVD